MSKRPDQIKKAAPKAESPKPARAVRKTKTAEVDGKVAQVVEHPPAPEPTESPKFPTIEVPNGAYSALQILFNDGAFNSGKNLVRKDAPCQADAMVGDVVVKCPHRAVVQSADMRECPNCHSKKKLVKRQLCLPHGAIHWGAQQSVTTQTELFDDGDHTH